MQAPLSDTHSDTALSSLRVRRHTHAHTHLAGNTAPAGGIVTGCILLEQASSGRRPALDADDEVASSAQASLLSTAPPSPPAGLLSVMAAQDAKATFFTEYGESSRYTIKEVIGKGSYGVVCSAVDNTTGAYAHAVCVLEQWAGRRAVVCPVWLQHVGGGLRPGLRAVLVPTTKGKQPHSLAALTRPLAPSAPGRCSR